MKTFVLWLNLTICRNIYKRLLTGSAKLFVGGTQYIRDWATLRTALLKEFDIPVNSADIHRQLQSRRKQYNETPHEYLYKMIEIAKATVIDEESLIQYVIDGIKDEKVNKIVLYEATTIEELKVRLRIYDKLKVTSGHQNNETHQQRKHSNNNDVGIRKGKRRYCFKCGDVSHLSNNCPIKSGEYKCFKCNTLGHRSFECKKQIDSRFKVNTEPSVNAAHKRCNMIKNVTVKGKSIDALIDTGCDLILCREDFFNKLSGVQLISSKISLSVLGNREIETLGFFKAELGIDGILFDVKCYVIPEVDMFFPVIVGNDLLKQATLLIDQSGIHFSRSANVTNPDAVKQNKIQELQSEFGSICCLAEFKENLQTTGNAVMVELDHLQFEKREEVSKLIEEYKPIQKLGSPIEMNIILKDERPIYERPRRMPVEDRKGVEKQINTWLQDKIIQPSSSEFAAPVVLVSKKDGSKRLCCDYRRINEQIVKDHFPMPLIDDVLDQLQEAKVFTTLDLVNGFFHVPVSLESRKYTSFIVHNGQYEFLKVPFGICNSPSVFTRFVSIIFKPLVREGILLTYMDDLVIPAGNYDEAMKRLKKVLEVASKNGLKIKWTKSQIMKERIDFLGYIIEDGTIRPSSEKTRAVLEFPRPQDKKSLQRFLGLTSYFRRFIVDYAIIAKPLSDLLKKDKAFKFKDEQEDAFQKLKNILARSPVLKLFDQNAYTEIHTDASKEGFGAILLQRNNDNQLLHPVQYMSRKTTPAEQRYHSYELEVLAIIQALKKWRIYVLGRRIKIVTDCNAFAMTIKKKDVPLRVARWAMFLQDFDYVIEHRSGTKMRHVDALSRNAMVIIDTVTHRIRQAQSEDSHLRAIRKVLEMAEYDDYYTKNDILYKGTIEELVVIPASMEEEIIRSTHKQGHYSTAKTEELIKRKYYIPDLKAKVVSFVRSCVECIMAERKSGKQEGFLSPIDKEDKPLQTFHIDHIGPMEETKKKYNYILVVVDGFSKFVWLYPTKSTSSEEAIDRLKRQSVVFGNPRRIISDRGTAFTSRSFRNYCEEEGIQHLLITTGVPRGNGQVERMNRGLIALLTKMSLEEPRAWYRHVGRAQQLINNTPARSTKFSPFSILTGLNMRINAVPDLQEILEEENLSELQREQCQIRQEAKLNILKIQQENCRGYNKKRKVATVYKLNDLVAVKRTQFGVGLKLKAKFLGPYKIVKRLKHDRYEIEKVGDHEGPRLTTASADGLKRWGNSFGTNGVSGRPNVGSRKLRSGNPY